MSENEQDFEGLRRVLALKRHEVPPPGYFEGFSGDVIARIRARETTRELPWLLRILQAFEAKPAYSVSLASTMCVLLLFGIISVEQNPGVASVSFQTDQNSLSAVSVNSLAVASQGSDSVPSLAEVNTNPPVDLSPNTALFNPSPSPYFQQASFSPASN